MKHVDLYVDGSYYIAENRGGYGAVLIYGNKIKVLSGQLEDSTNNQAEILALVEALRLLKEPCEVDVYSDSTYLVDTFIGFYSKKKNQNCWTLLEDALKPHLVRVEWVRGHNKNKYNELAHYLAKRWSYRRTYSEREAKND